MMTNEQRIKYVQSFIVLVKDSLTYREALSHSTFARGVLAAWFADMTIRTDQYKSLMGELDDIMAVKRTLPLKGDVL